MVKVYLVSLVFGSVVVGPGSWLRVVFRKQRFLRLIATIPKLQGPGLRVIIGTESTIQQLGVFGGHCGTFPALPRSESPLQGVTLHVTCCEPNLLAGGHTDWNPIPEKANSVINTLNLKRRSAASTSLSGTISVKMSHLSVQTQLSALRRARDRWRVSRDR